MQSCWNTFTIPCTRSDALDNRVGVTFCTTLVGGSLTVGEAVEGYRTVLHAELVVEL